MTTIQQNPFSDLLENTMQSFLKEKIETLLKEEIKNYLGVEHPEEANSRNGYYCIFQGDPPSPLNLESQSYPLSQWISYNPKNIITQTS
ncbi:hypothetical protein DFP97_10244 [Paenibacillus prosopidis]|uniref:Uncharacterized protein n=1 Tax=Paenibacillus prosopidis TaxID=630520 RepID=A0A368W677_9BACL|nr:hypothetical protein [Paenibacillus prosopidis]RCW50852.1 hypothetical protein DFP97_10244 [Paenibacillus prosopidis]